MISSVLLGLIGYLARRVIFSLVFSGKLYDTRSVGTQISFILALLAATFILAGMISSQAQRMRWKFLTCGHVQNESRAILLTTTGLLCILLFNSVLIHFNLDYWEYQPIREPYSQVKPIGVDYRQGIYQPIENFKRYGTPYVPIDNQVLAVYPPFTYLIFQPLSFLNENIGFLIVAVLSIISVVISLWLTFKLVRHFIKISDAVAWVSFSFVSVLIVTSRYFQLMIDRGNVDAIMHLLMVLAIYLMLTKPGSLWLQVILLSMAAHLKVYPVLLFPLLLLYHRKKAIIPIILINSLLAISMGPRVLGDFLHTMSSWSVERYYWWGNHSAAAFTFMLNESFPGMLKNTDMVYWGLFVLPIFLAAGMAVFVHRNVKSNFKWFLYFVLFTLLMCLLPAVSHDYKLIVLSSALMIIIMTTLHWLASNYSAINIILFAILLATLFIFHRPFSYIADDFLIFRSHYVTTMALYLLFSLVLPELSYSDVDDRQMLA